jgi:hypothetical protein
MEQAQKLRRFPAHRYKYGKQTKAIDLETFKAMLDKVDKRRLRNPPKYPSLLIKALLSLLYWTGLRKTEAIGSPPKHYVLKPCKRHSEPIAKVSEAVPGILKEDLWIEGEWLFVKALARKHGSREAPLQLHTSLPFIPLIIEQWKVSPPKSKVFPISEWDAWHTMKLIDQKKYLHFFRFNRITELCANPRMSVADICNWTGLTAITIEAYMERSGRYIRETAMKMREQYVNLNG